MEILILPLTDRGSRAIDRAWNDTPLRHRLAFRAAGFKLSRTTAGIVVTCVNPTSIIHARGFALKIMTDNGAEAIDYKIEVTQ